MGIRIGKKGSSAVVTGRYPAVVFGVKSRKTRFGTALLFEFELLDEAHAGVHVDGMFPAEATVKNKTGRLLNNAGVDWENNDGIASEDVIGKRVDVLVGQRQGAQYMFDCVKDTYPPLCG